MLVLTPALGMTISENNCSICENNMDSAAQVLFGKTRQAVLALLLERPEDSYYLRQMCQLSGISPGAMQAELRQLTRAGLLERAKDGNRVAYRANARHPVFESLR